MEIVCLGWGSLIWDARELACDGTWRLDGPYLPIEFARQSSDGRITLVIHESFHTVQSLWTIMNVENLEQAIESLRRREKTAPSHIHYISLNDTPANDVENEVLTWMEEKQFDCAIWTGLPPKFSDTNGKIPTIDELFEYFERKKENLLNIEEYIRKAPEQIQTAYRNQLEAKLDEIKKQMQS